MVIDESLLGTADAFQRIAPGAEERAEICNVARGNLSIPALALRRMHETGTGRRPGTRRPGTWAVQCDPCCLTEMRIGRLYVGGSGPLQAVAII